MEDDKDHSGVEVCVLEHHCGHYFAGAKLKLVQSEGHLDRWYKQNGRVSKGIDSKQIIADKKCHNLNLYQDVLYQLGADGSYFWFNIYQNFLWNDTYYHIQM